jgi:CHASE3 domain sensor protein
MTRRYVRLTLFVLLILALGAASWQIALLETSLREADARADGSARAAAGALDALLDARASERAFLAEGQGAPYWRTRVDRALDRLREHMAALRASAAGRRELFGSTDEALARLFKLEQRIGDHAVAGRRPHAEDLIFADALEASLTVERDVREAQQVLAAAARLQVHDLRERELIIVALAAAVSLLVALLLVPLARPGASSAPAEAEISPPTSTVDLPLNLRDTTPRPTAVETAPTPNAPTVVVPVAGGRAAAVRAAQGDRLLAARLSSAADLCTALSRVRDSRDLPSLLAHITRVLDAQGAIVWMADMRERRLVPALAHGYRDTALARMGSIGWDAQNPAAEAFREREPRTVDPAAGAPGALIVPLVSGYDCAGVITVELRAGESKAGEPVAPAAPDATVIALARIFAAQLAGLVAPAAAAPEEPVEPTRRASSIATGASTGA